MSSYDTTEPATGRHPVDIGHLVMGIAFLGLVGVWALYETGIVETTDLNWFLPVPWLAAGAAGLVALAVASRRRARSAQTAQAPEATDDTDSTYGAAFAEPPVATHDDGWDARYAEEMGRTIPDTNTHTAPETRADDTEENR